jgi:phospholipid/cholesterol/gamma-HCH transport system substrate-binding protein
MRLRYSDEWVGLLVIIAMLLFFGVAFEAGIVSRWFQSNVTLRILLPEQGSAGLSPGADVEVLGTKAGEVSRVVINPNQQMYAEATIEEQAIPFIRRDSVAVIRKRFGIAGAAYLDIGRGKGQPLDWAYAVIPATTERDPTESIGTLIDHVRGKVFPVLDDSAAPPTGSPSWSITCRKARAISGASSSTTPWSRRRRRLSLRCRNRSTVSNRSWCSWKMPPAEFPSWSRM